MFAEAKCDKFVYILLLCPLNEWDWNYTQRTLKSLSNVIVLLVLIQHENSTVLQTRNNIQHYYDRVNAINNKFSDDSINTIQQQHLTDRITTEKKNGKKKHITLTRLSSSPFTESMASPTYSPLALSAAIPRKIFDIRMGIRFSRPPLIEIPNPLLSDLITRTCIKWSDNMKGYEEKKKTFFFSFK